MGLINGSLQIGRSAIQASQAALQIIGNNVANASSPDYSRQRPVLEPVAGGELLPGVRPGVGVRLATFQRMADEAVNSRLRSAVSDRAAAQVASETLGQIETVFNGLGTDNLASRLTEFFNSFTALANDPTSSACRNMVLLAGSSLARTITSYRAALTDQRVQINRQLTDLTEQANTLIRNIADLNAQITRVEFGMVDTSAGALCDQRDGALRQLAELMDIRTITGTGGSVNVYVGSAPLVMSGDPFVLTSEADTASGYADTVIRLAGTGQVAPIAGGAIGGLLAARDQALRGALDELDRFALALINEVNLLHASGQGLVGFGTITGTNAVLDANAALNAAGLKLAPVNGTFQIHLTDSAGNRTSRTVEVDLDGLGSDTTLNSLAAALNGVAGVWAVADATGTLTIGTQPGLTMTFSEDSSGVLAALGINTFFSGTSGQDIAVRAGLTGAQVAAACNHSPGDNSNALRLAQLAEARLDSLSGASLTEHYRNIVAAVGGWSAQASVEFEAADALTQTLTGQRDAISGVNIDEEAIDLIRYQRAFQGAAHYVALINELLDELVRMI